MLSNLPLARSAVDPDSDARRDPGLLGRLTADPTTLVVLVHHGQVATRPDGGLDVRRSTELPGSPWPPDHLGYLGRDDDAAYLVLVLPEDLGAERDLDGVPVHEDAALADLAARCTFSHLRDVGDAFGDRDAGLATTAVALAAWHARHPRCPRCGEPTQVVDSGWVRRCDVDHSQHYPRTDPAVIMAVTDAEDRILLGHAAHWPAGRFSTLAGYVEPGESLENAVRREVHEETGVVVGPVQYMGSQPWPFPASLMLGFTARVAAGAGTDVRVDGLEITDARFFGREELTAAVRDGWLHLPMRSSIARALIEDWFGGPVG